MLKDDNMVIYSIYGRVLEKSCESVFIVEVVVINTRARVSIVIVIMKEG